MGKLIGHGTQVERTSTFLPKRLSGTVKRSTLNRFLMRNVQNWLIEGTRLNYSG
jgi:hypothetical protein